MRHLVSRMLHQGGRALIYLAERIYQKPRTRQRQRLMQWFRDDGDKTLLVNHDLDEDSLVFDLGGYEGQWASDIYGIYSCYIHVFEPVEEFAQRIERRFSLNRKISLHHLGLSDETKSVEIRVDQDRSSIFRPGKRSVKAQLIRAADFIQENNIRAIDLMKINIEGGEFDLLDHLIESGYAPIIKNIQVQFHDDCVSDAEQRMSNIQGQLEKTHYLTYQYPFVWENWRLKGE